MKIGIIGLGYVGLPLVIQFAKSGAQGSSYGNLKRDIRWAPPPPLDQTARFTSGHMTTSSMPSRPIPKASPKARGPCVGRMLGIPGG